MTINTTENGTEIIVAVEGSLDTVTSPELDTALAPLYEKASRIVLDLKELTYTSSAGLRVILKAHKTMKGNFAIRNATEDVMEVFDVTGFTDILTFE